jgi:hypothetical protein
MPKLQIKRDDFAQAWILASGRNDGEGWLDLHTGEVLIFDTSDAHRLRESKAKTVEAFIAFIENVPDIPDWLREQLTLLVRVRLDKTKRYLKVRQSAPPDDYELMEDFVNNLEDVQQRQQLQSAMHGKGAFRRFKDTLRNYPETRAAWFAFRDQQGEAQMRRWLKAHDIEPEFV